MAHNSSIGTWSFHPLITSFPSTILPNIAYWNVSNGTWEYQVQLSWPLNWTSTNVNATAETLYVLDGNTLAQTATEAVRKRQFVEPTQQDTIVVTIGYPNLLPNSSYSPGRFYDYQMPVCENCTHRDTDFPPNADNFITFLDDILRPWIHNTVFPHVKFNRDGLFGHSFGGNFVLYALIVRPDLFDVFLSASPGLWWDGDYIFTQLGPLQAKNGLYKETKPALQITYGGYEQIPQKRRKETLEAYNRRRTVLSSLMRMADLCNRLYNELKDSPSLRHIELREYPFSYHAAVASAGLCDGIDYFLDW